ncbi:D-2-hydroxyacid dehydrogenase [Paenibacillus sp. TRM 82003]|nr:D-2-hydroxyacid dehydrogenase [Paenibacillus sp. TRM 82003]
MKGGGRKPNILIRCDVLPEGVVPLIADRAGELFVETWEPGVAEPPLKAPADRIDIVVTRGLADTLHHFLPGERLKWAHSITVGVEKMLTKEVVDSEIFITNIKGLNAIPIAEYVIGAILAWNRGFFTFAKQQQAKLWKTIPVRETAGSTVGIIGFGNIGREVAVRAKALGMEVIACGRSQPETVPPHIDQFIGADNVDRLLEASDYVVNCLPASAQTRHYLNSQKFLKMKSDALFLNVGRGQTVDESALIDCLQQRRIAGAVLDVFEKEPLPPEHPFWTMDNVVVSPHNAFASQRHYDRIFQEFIDNLERFNRGEPLQNQIDKQRGY